MNSSMAQAPLRILLVDDDVVDRMACHRALGADSAAGLSLFDAETAAQGLDLVREQRPDCILLDYHLPDMDGLEFLAALSGETGEAGVPVIMLTGSDNVLVAVEAMKRGARDYLVKDSERQYLRLLPVVIERVLREQRAIIAKKEAEEALRGAHQELERRVVERTAELAQANLQLIEKIAERKRGEEALFREKELLHVTLESIGEAVITTDAQCAISYLNPVAERLTGWRDDEARGLPVGQVFQVVSEATHEPVADAVARCLSKSHCPPLEGPCILIRRDGRELAIADSISPIHGHQSQVVGGVIVFRDVTEQRQAARVLSYQASHDALTGLVNRIEFERRVERVLAASMRELGGQNAPQHALCYLDLDKFKTINDTCGHAAGDELLRQVTRLLHGKVRQRDTLARLGGDEFAVLLEHCTLEDAQRLAEEWRDAVHQFRFEHADHVFTIGVSIGVVAIDNTFDSLAALVSAADTACYMAKEAGRNRVHLFESPDVNLAERSIRKQWMERISQALEEDRLRIYYQPASPLTAQAQGNSYCECLLRLINEEGKLVPAAHFIPAAEHYQLMPAIDRWVIRAVVSDCATLRARAPQHPLSLFAINISSSSCSQEMVWYLRDLLAHYRVPPQMLCFEVTEAMVVADLDRVAQVANGLKALGCWLALADSGSGLSILSRLKELPVDFLKINGRPVKQIAEGTLDWAMARAINQVAHVMLIQTVAECVETEAALDMLRNLGIDHAQGYAVAVPRLFEELMQDIQTGQEKLA